MSCGFFETSIENNEIEQLEMPYRSLSADASGPVDYLITRTVSVHTKPLTKRSVTKMMQKCLEMRHPATQCDGNGLCSEHIRPTVASFVDLKSILLI